MKMMLIFAGYLGVTIATISLLPLLEGPSWVKVTILIAVWSKGWLGMAAYALSHDKSRCSIDYDRAEIARRMQV